MHKKLCRGLLYDLCVHIIIKLMHFVVVHPTYTPSQNASASLLHAHTNHLIDRDTAFCAQYSKIKYNTTRNLSSYILSNIEKVVLSLGLKFLPDEKVDRNRLITSYINSILKLEN